VDLSGISKKVMFHFHKTKAESDEWIEFGSPRIAPLYTQVTKGNKKDGAKKKRDVSKSNSPPVPTLAQGENKPKSDSGTAAEEKHVSENYNGRMDEKNESVVSDPPLLPKKKPKKKAKTKIEQQPESDFRLFDERQESHSSLVDSRTVVSDPPPLPKKKPKKKAKIKIEEQPESDSRLIDERQESHSSLVDPSTVVMDPPPIPKKKRKKKAKTKIEQQPESDSRLMDERQESHNSLVDSRTVVLDPPPIPRKKPKKKPKTKIEQQPEFDSGLVDERQESHSSLVDSRTNAAAGRWPDTERASPIASFDQVSHFQESYSQQPPAQFFHNNELHRGSRGASFDQTSQVALAEQLLMLASAPNTPSDPRQSGNYFYQGPGPENMLQNPALNMLQNPALALNRSFGQSQPPPQLWPPATLQSDPYSQAALHQLSMFAAGRNANGQNHRPNYFQR
jgi:hypothetical protein